MTLACCLVLAARARPTVRSEVGLPRRAAWFWLRERPTLGNEAGMWPGINGFTNCAPIADWSGVRKIYGVQRTNWVAHTWRGLPCVRRENGLPRLAHIAKGAMYAPPAIMRIKG